jgi:hypothetical protein
LWQQKFKLCQLISSTGNCNSNSLTFFLSISLLLDRKILRKWSHLEISKLWFFPCIAFLVTFNFMITARMHALQIQECIWKILIACVKCISCVSPYSVNWAHTISFSSHSNPIGWQLFDIFQVGFSDSLILRK